MTPYQLYSRLNVYLINSVFCNWFNFVLKTGKWRFEDNCIQSMFSRQFWRLKQRQLHYDFQLTITSESHYSRNQCSCWTLSPSSLRIIFPKWMIAANKVNLVAILHWHFNGSKINGAKPQEMELPESTLVFSNSNGMIYVNHMPTARMGSHLFIQLHN